jgi:hypothetical protein
MWLNITKKIAYTIASAALRAPLAIVTYIDENKIHRRWNRLNTSVLVFFYADTREKYELTIAQCSFLLYIFSDYVNIPFFSLHIRYRNKTINKISNKLDFFAKFARPFRQKDTVYNALRMIHLHPTFISTDCPLQNHHSNT